MYTYVMKFCLNVSMHSDLTALRVPRFSAAGRPAVRPSLVFSCVRSLVLG